VCSPDKRSGGFPSTTRRTTGSSMFIKRSSSSEVYAIEISWRSCSTHVGLEGQFAEPYPRYPMLGSRRRPIAFRRHLAAGPIGKLSSSTMRAIVGLKLRPFNLLETITTAAQTSGRFAFNTPLPFPLPFPFRSPTRHSVMLNPQVFAKTPRRFTWR